MFDFLKLKKEISETTADIDADDVINVKTKLKKLGHYEEPEWGLTKISDRQMFDGIRKFQQDNKLQIDGIMKPNGETERTLNKLLKVKEKSNPTSGALQQIKGATSDMYSEYKLMKSHKYKYLDDYYHCKANYNAAKRGNLGEMTATVLGNGKEAVDYFKNRLYKGLPFQASIKDYWNDINVNKIGRERASNDKYSSAKDACSDYRDKNKKLPERYW